MANYELIEVDLKNQEVWDDMQESIREIGVDKIRDYFNSVNDLEGYKFGNVLLEDWDTLITNFVALDEEEKNTFLDAFKEMLIEKEQE